MPTPRLPTEVCERVISFISDYDWMASEGVIDDYSRHSLLDCCRVCRSWVPGSQHLLFVVVALQNGPRALAFIDTVTHSPSGVRPWVECLTIWPPGFPYGTRAAPPCYYDWIYRAVAALPKLLTNLHRLSLEHLPPLHPTLIPLVSHLNSIQRLDLLDLENQSFRDIVRLVNRLHKLRALEVRSCKWTQPLRFYAGRQLHLESLDADPPLNTLKDWLISTQSTSALRALRYRYLRATEIVDLVTILKASAASLQFVELWSDFSSIDDLGSLSFVDNTSLRHLRLVDLTLDSFIPFVSRLSLLVPPSINVIEYAIIQEKFFTTFSREDIVGWSAVDIALSDSGFSNLTHFIIWIYEGDVRREEAHLVLQRVFPQSYLCGILWYGIRDENKAFQVSQHTDSCSVPFSWQEPYRRYQYRFREDDPGDFRPSKGRNPPPVLLYDR